MRMRACEAAVDRIWTALDLNPHEPDAPLRLALAYLQRGMPVEATDALLLRNSAVVRHLGRLSTRVFGVASTLRLHLVLEAAKSRQRCTADPYAAALILAHVGDRDGMFRCLDAALDDPRLAPVVARFLNLEPAFALYHSEARFQNVAQRTERSASRNER